MTPALAEYMDGPVADALRAIAGGPLGTVALAETMSIAWGQIAGSNIPIEYRGDVAILRPSPEQANRIADWIVRQIRKEPGSVRTDISGVWPRVVWRAWWPWIAGALGVAYVTGGMTWPRGWRM